MTARDVCTVSISNTAMLYELGNKQVAQLRISHHCCILGAAHQTGSNWSDNYVGTVVVVIDVVITQWSLSQLEIIFINRISDCPWRSIQQHEVARDSGGSKFSTNLLSLFLCTLFWKRACSFAHNPTLWTMLVNKNTAKSETDEAASMLCGDRLIDHPPCKRSNGSRLAIDMHKKR